MKISRIFVALFLLAVTGCSSSGTGLNLYSYEQEAAEGNKFSTQIEKETKIMTDPVLDRYITNLGQRMIRQGLQDPHFQYTFKVVDSSEVNAFAIPGGHLYVNLALLKEAESEAELIGVIGHEIGHVVHRHGTKRLTDAMLLQLAAAGAATATGEKSGQYVGLGVLLFGQAGLLHYGRQAELESDRTGVDILHRTGYDVYGLSRFFEKLLKIERERGVKGGGLSDLLATHPPTASRISKAEKYIGSLGPQKSAMTTSPEFAEMRRHVASLAPSTSSMSQKNNKRE